MSLICALSLVTEGERAKGACAVSSNAVVRHLNHPEHAPYLPCLTPQTPALRLNYSNSHVDRGGVHNHPSSSLLIFIKKSTLFFFFFVKLVPRYL